jgi:hypothetical protein
MRSLHSKALWLQASTGWIYPAFHVNALKEANREQGVDSLGFVHPPLPGGRHLLEFAGAQKNSDLNCGQNAYVLHCDVYLGKFEQ